MLQAKPGRNGKQQQKQNSPNLGPAFFPSPVDNTDSTGDTKEVIIPRDGDVDSNGRDDCRPKEGGEEHLVAEHQHDGREEPALQRKHTL